VEISFAKKENILMKKMQEIVLTIVMVLMLTLGLVAFTATPTLAASRHPIENNHETHSIGTIQQGLSVDCSHLPTSQKALKILAQHNICGLGGIDANPPPAKGNCGVLTLSLSGGSSAGVLYTKVTVTSYWYLGPIYKFVWNGSWYNTDTSSGGGMSDIVGGTGYTRSSYTEYYTDYGNVVGVLSYAEDQTILGISCTSNTRLTGTVYI